MLAHWLADQFTAGAWKSLKDMRLPIVPFRQFARVLNGGLQYVSERLGIIRLLKSFLVAREQLLLRDPARIRTDLKRIGGQACPDEYRTKFEVHFQHLGNS